MKQSQKQSQQHPEDDRYLFDLLQKHSEEGPYPLHMPGHKRRLGALTDPYKIDLTEIKGTDDLHAPEGILLEAQQRAARQWGSENTYFLVNGSTCGMLAAISACFGPRAKGRKLLMGRNCHLSVWHGAILERLDTVYLVPKMLRAPGGTSLAGPIAAEDVAAALEADGQIGAVCITSPTYEGVVSDIRRIAAICRKKGVPLIVDEAHGAHFGFHPAFPPSAVGCGADIVIQSLHKTLPALTQCALAHVNGTLADRERFERYLRIYQTSSPSYVLMASMDECVRWIGKDGKDLLKELARNAQRFYLEAEKLEKLEIVRTDDPSRIVIGAGKSQLSGERICDILRERFHLECEMAAPGYALALMTAADDQKAFDGLMEALKTIDRECVGMPGNALRQKCRSFSGSQWRLPERAMPLWQAFGEQTVQVPLKESAGSISGDFAGLYPPGIPFLVPGELIDEKMIAFLENLLTQGSGIRGIQRGPGKKIRTVAD